MTIVRAFYNANGAGQFNTSLALLADGATLASWSQGMNYYHLAEKHLTGKEQVRTALGDRGLSYMSYTPGQPHDPIFHEANVKVSGNKVTFTLQSDQPHPNGRPYNPYSVEVVLEGCKIKSLTVVELITWL